MLSRSISAIRLLTAGLLAALALASAANAQLRTGHAIPGFHGSEFAVAPPLGLSYENATVFYTSSQMTDQNGNETGSGSISSFSNHNTLTYNTPWLIFGANLALRARIPFVNSEPNAHTTNITSDGIGLGDIYLQPLSLYWEGNRHLFNFGYAYWLDTGQFTPGARDNLGKGFTSHEVSLGMTYYPTAKHDWHMSLLGRYEFHDKLEGADLDPGDDIVIDWSVGKRLNERWNVSAVGYGVWQATRESGADGNVDIGFYGTSSLGVRRSMPCRIGAGGSRCALTTSSTRSIARKGRCCSSA